MGSSGGGGGFVSDLANTVTNTGKAFYQPFLDLGQAKFDKVLPDVANIPRTIAGELSSPTEMPESPSAPQSLVDLQKQQLDYANKFREQMPQMQNQMARQLSQQAEMQQKGQIAEIKNRNNARGLTYSGINQGQQLGARAANQGLLAQAISGANANLENASNTLNNQALQTGVGIQQTQQSIQNQIYEQQMAQLAADNSITGSVLGFGLMAGMAGAKGK